MKWFFIMLLCSCAVADNLQISSFNADSVGLPKGTPVSILPSNGGYIRAASGSISNSAFGLLAQDGFVGFPSSVLIYGEIDLPDWTGIVGASSLSANAYYFLSSTPGKLSTTSSGVSQIVGVALSTTRFLVNPQLLNTNAASALIWTNDTVTPSVGLTINPSNETFYIGPNTGNHQMTNVNTVLTLLGYPPGGDFITFTAQYNNFGLTPIVPATLQVNFFRQFHGQVNEGQCFAIWGQNTATNTDNSNWIYGGDATIAVKGTVTGNDNNNFGASVGVQCKVQNRAVDQAGVTAQAAATVNAQTNIGFVANSTVNGKTGGANVGAYAEVAGSSPALPIFENAVLLIDNRDSGVPLTIWRSNQVDIANMSASGVATEVQLVLTGTTNFITFGTTNVAPAGTATPTKWVSVQISGEATQYRIPLYQ